MEIVYEGSPSDSLLTSHLMPGGFYHMASLKSLFPAGHRAAIFSQEHFENLSFRFK